MSRKRITYLIVPLLILIPVVALATDFYWIDGDGDFDDCNHWTRGRAPGIPDSCYPDRCNHNATIEGTYPGLTVDMTTETIHDLMLAATPEFALTLDGQGSKKTLTCDSLRIGGTWGYVSLTGKGIIKTQGCP